MRLVTVQAPEGQASEVARVAFAVGIAQAAVRQHQVHRPDRQVVTKDVIDLETATPTAKAFIDALMTAPFYDPAEYAVSVRQPRSIVSREPPRRITWPLVEPTMDLFEELWQFSHVTVGFIGRVLIAAMLLAYGMIVHQLLLIVAGLLFLPLLPVLLAVGFGLWTREWRLVGQATGALLIGTGLLVASGVVVALMTGPPLRFNDSPSLLTSFLMSLAIGVAAGLATADDVGRRELIGLAAATQVAILPVWFGIAVVFGFPAAESLSPTQRALMFCINVGTIMLAALCIYAFLGMRGAVVRRFAMGTAKNGDPRAPIST
jgi:hypothetical protein